MSLPLKALGTAVLAAVGAGMVAKKGPDFVPVSIAKTHNEEIGYKSLFLAAAMLGAGYVMGGARRGNSVARGLMYAGALNGVGAGLVLSGKAPVA